MWKIMVVGNQKPENTQVKVLLSQLRCTWYSPHSQHHAGICGRVQCVFPGVRTPTYLGMGLSENWILNSQSKRDTKVLRLWMHQPWSYSTGCCHLSCLQARESCITHQRKERHDTNIITHAERNLTWPLRCLCCRGLVSALQWSRKAPQKRADTPLQVVRAVPVRDSPLSNDFIEKLDLRLPSPSFRQNLRKLEHLVYCTDKPILLPPASSSLSYIED